MIQNTNGMYPYQQSHLMGQRFMDPSALKNDSSAQQGEQILFRSENVSDAILGQTQQQQMRGLEASPYFNAANNKMPGTTLDPRSLQMPQQFGQQYPGQILKPNTMSHLQALQGGQLHNAYQMQPQPVQMAPSKAAPKPKVRRAGKSSGSSSSSEDDLDIEEEPEQKPAAITIAKPTDERGKILWEVVDAVWTPRNKPAPPDKIRSAISFIGNAVRNLREKWKAANDSLKQAELPDSKTKELAQGLKTTVSTYRETMDTLAARVATFGHPSILSRYVLVKHPVPTLIVHVSSVTQQTCLYVCNVVAAGQDSESDHSASVPFAAAWQCLAFVLGSKTMWSRRGLDSSISCYQITLLFDYPNIS